MGSGPPGRDTDNEGTELRFEVDGAGEAVVVEQLLDRRPDGEGGVILLHDDVEEVGGDGGVEPVDDALVDHGPLRIGEAGRGGAADMVPEAELPEGRVEEAPPLGVGGALKIEDYMNMRADVHSLDLSERDSGV